MKQPATTTGTAIQGGTFPSADWQHLDLEQLQKVLQASPEGLTQAEALRRLALYGPNAIPERRVNRFLKLLSYVWGPIPWMIELAVILSALVGHWADFWIILVLLVANALVGFWEENQAGNAIAALKAKLALKARVRRDGAWSTLAARELVPGDVVQLRLGEIVPADARLLEAPSRWTSRPSPASRCRPPSEPGRRCSPARSSARGKPTPWCTAPARIPISASPPS